MCFCDNACACEHVCACAPKHTNVLVCTPPGISCTTAQCWLARNRTCSAAHRWLVQQNVHAHTDAHRNAPAHTDRRASTGKHTGESQVCHLCLCVVRSTFVCACLQVSACMYLCGTHLQRRVCLVHFMQEGGQRARVTHGVCEVLHAQAPLAAPLCRDVTARAVRSTRMRSKKPLASTMY